MAVDRVWLASAEQAPRGQDLEGFLQALHVAIRLEEEGVQFYELNARRVRNPRGRAAFQILLRDERIHLGRLRSQLDALRDLLGGTADAERLSAPPSRDRTPNPIFSRGRTLADRDADEREVLREGISIEWDAYSFFQERARAADDPWTRLVYDDLALDERGHYEALVEAYETILLGRR